MVLPLGSNGWNTGPGLGLASIVALGTAVYFAYTKFCQDERADSQPYQLVYRVLPSHLDVTKKAIFEASGGIYAGGMYKEVLYSLDPPKKETSDNERDQVAYETSGRGQFLPVAEAGAVPHTGTVGVLETTEETRVEIMCVGKKVTKAAVEALKRLVNSVEFERVLTKEKGPPL